MIIPVGFSQVNLRYTGLNLPTGGEVTFGIQNINNLAPAAVGNLVVTSYTTAGMPALFSSDATLTSVLVKNGPNATGPFGSVSATVNGTDGADPNPPQVAMLVKKFTTQGGRTGIGRSYWPNVSANKILDSGALDAAYQATAQTACNAFITQLDANDIPMVLLHADSGSGVPLNVIGYVVQSQGATQRRRNRR